MVIAGAGGHSLEMLDILISQGYNESNIFFFDDTKDAPQLIHRTFKVINAAAELKAIFNINPFFCLGVGNPEVRKLLKDKLTYSNGKLVGIKAANAIVSSYAGNSSFDAMSFSFVSNSVRLGEGVLINTGAKIHHNVIIGDFTEISPSANVLGNVQIGDYCSIGSNATILPRVKVGNNVIIGAGAVVREDLPDNVMAVGVPAIIKRINDKRKK